MLRLACAWLLSANLAAALFYHELSSTDLKDDKLTSAYGFSLGYETSDARLVIGAPRYNTDGRVYHCSIKDIKRNKCNDPVHVDFKGIGNRTVNPDQYFYLGASIAATKNGFVMCAPLRTAYFGDIDPDTKTSASFGACFIYDNIKKTPNIWSLNSKLSVKWAEGGGGWSTLVDDTNDRIIISQLFKSKTALCSQIPEADNYSECFKPESLSLVTTYGQAMTYGNYVAQSKICYAFSVNSIGTEKGYIDFFSNDLINASATDCPPRLKDVSGSVGSMFGAALGSADVTRDGLADLLVGAPAQVRGPTGYDTGAVQVYSKLVHTDNSGTETAKMDLKITIWGMMDGARFGTSLSISDVNGDSYPEIIISAPFDKSEGALYIICGYALHESIKKKRGTVSILELPRTQMIEKTKSFGFSLQPVADYNDNGSDELAVGSPEESAVTMYQGVRSITVNVTSEFTDYATATNTEFSFASCVTIEKPKEPKEITMRLLVKNALTGDKATFKNKENATYEIVLTDPPTNISGNGTVYRYCRNYYITSLFSCKVNTTVSLNENIIETEKEFKNTWVTLSPQSSLTREVQPQCNCGSKPCSPEYSVELLWSGHTGRTHQYIVGSSDMETVSIVVSNKGTMGCGACAKVRVSGTLVHTLACAKDKDGMNYKCDLPAPFRPGTNKTIDIQLQMNTLSTEEKIVTIDVEVHKECSKPEAVISSLKINYNFENVLQNVIIQGTTINRTISEAELQDSKEDKLSVEQTFTIFNNQSFQWNKIFVTIEAIDNTYIHNVTMRIGQPNKYCEKPPNMVWKCSMALGANSSTAMTVSTTIVKSKLAETLKSDNARIMSKLKLQLLPHTFKEKSITTVIALEEKPKSPMGTIFIAIGVGLLVLLIIGFILYKLNFFKRKTKEDLEELKKEIRSQSKTSGRLSDNQSQATEPAVEAVDDPAHDFDMVDLIVDETPLAKSLSSEQLNSIAANSDSVKLEECPKKREYDEKVKFTHV